jgi:hypothetical protein
LIGLLIVLVGVFSPIMATAQEIWVARYKGPVVGGSDVAYAVAVDGSGNVYVTGASVGSGNLGDYATVKYNASGVQQWVARYDGPSSGDELAYAIAVDGSGNVYVTGYSTGSGTGFDYATIKYNASGTQQWVARYNGPGNGNDYADAIAIDGAGNVYVTGWSTGSGTGYDYATIKYNSAGQQQWVARYDGPVSSDDHAIAIAVDGGGNVYVTGGSAGLGVGCIPTCEDYATIKYDASGTQQWVARYNGPGNSLDSAYAMAIDGSGNVYVTGFSTGSGTGYDFATIKYNSSGTQQWVDRYNGPGNGNDAQNGPYAIAVDASGNPYVTGQSIGSNGDYDYATIKYYACWPACTTRAKKDSLTFARRRGISQHQRAARPASRIEPVAKKDRKSTDSLKNFRKRLALID